MSQIKAYAQGAWADTTLGNDAPAFYWDGTKWVQLDAAPPTTGGGPTPPSFDTLPNLGIFLDSADPAGTGTAPADGAAVRTWAAKVGGQSFDSLIVAGETSDQTDARAPQYRAGTTTEPSFLKFSGATRLSAPVSVLPKSGPVTVYVVSRLATLGYGAVFSQGSSTAVNPCYVIDSGGGGARALRRTTDGAIALAQVPLIANAWRVMSFTSSDWKAVSLRGNEWDSAGTSSANTSTGVMDTDTTVIGGRISPDSSNVGKYGSLFGGDIAAIVTYNTAHDAVTRQMVEQQLATRYKIVLPSQGGTVDGPVARITAARLARSVEYGIPTTHRVTGKTLPGFHNSGPDVNIKSSDYQYIEGTFFTSSDGQIVSKKWINGNVVIQHAGVLFQDCIIYSTNDPKADTRNAPIKDGYDDPRFSRCEIFGKEQDQGTGIGYIRYTVEDSFLHDCEDETRLNKRTVIRRNVMGVHSNGFLPDGTRLHTDCVQANGGDNDPGDRSVVEGNTLIAQRHNLTKGNSAIILATEGANVGGVNQGSPLRHVTIEGNYLAGGSYTLYIKTAGTAGSPGPMEDIVVKNNVFRGTQPTNAPLPAGAYAVYGDAWLPYTSLADTFLTLTGNVREDGSAITITRSTPGGGEGD